MAVALRHLRVLSIRCVLDGAVLRWSAGAVALEELEVAARLEPEVGLLRLPALPALSALRLSQSWAVSPGARAGLTDALVGRALRTLTLPLGLNLP